MTKGQFADSVLHGLGIQPTSGNRRAFVGWMDAEGGHWNNRATFNPLNTTLNLPGAGNTGAQGNIKVYRNWQQGIEATVKTLQAGRYTGIRAALQRSDGNALARAIDASPWGTHGPALARVAQGGDPNQDDTKRAAQRKATSTFKGTTTGTPDTVTPGAIVPDPARAVGMANLEALGNTKATGGLPKLGLSSGGTTTRAAQLLASGAATKQLSPTVTPGQAPHNVIGKGGEVTDSTTSADTGAKGTVMFEGKRVAAWIAPALRYARQRGWKGQVTSGFRSFEEQTRIYNSGVRPAAKPGTSNHEGAEYPRGAVDVSDAETLSAILRRSPYANKLVWAGGKDPVHFSHPHGGSY